MDFKKTDLKEFVRIKNNSVQVGSFILSGKDGEHFVVLSPTTMISGYGPTEKEAEESFKESLLLFCKDILSLSTSKREEYLSSLGFSKEKFKTKNFSKLYVDSDGVLQGFDEGTVKKSFVQATEEVAA